MQHLKAGFFILLLLPIYSAYGQQDVQIGADFRGIRPGQGAYFDFSDPQGINIRVQLWGFVRNPGYYIIPARTTLVELITLAGGPTEASHLDDIRIYRMSTDSIYQFLKFDYDELLWKDSISKAISNPKVTAGDIIIIPGSPRFYFKDYLQVGLTIFSALVSITLLIINLTN